MAKKTRVELILITAIISGVSLLLTVVGYGTNQWVVGNVDLNMPSGATSNSAQYGLFTGTYTRTVNTPAVYGLTLTCDFGANKCAMLCGSITLRSQYLQSLVDGVAVSDGYSICTSTRTVREELDDPDIKDEVELDGFINCGLWLSTVILLGFSSLFGVISTILAIFNTVSNPVQTFLSDYGLFVYNCVASGCSLIVLILWGVQFAVTLSDNMAIYDTISTNGSSSGFAGLGFSYWFNLIAFVGYGSSAAILVVRSYLINNEPRKIVNLEDTYDNSIRILY